MLGNAVFTNISLFLFLLSFFVIGWAQTQKDERRKVSAALIGFGLVLLDTIYLAGVVVSMSLGG